MVKNRRRKGSVFYEEMLALQAFMRHTDNLMITLTNGFLIKELNPIAERLYGWRYQNVAGENFIALSRDCDYEFPSEEILKKHWPARWLRMLNVALARINLPWFGRLCLYLMWIKRSWVCYWWAKKILSFTKLIN